MSKFKAGDEVICIDDELSDNRLTMGKTYVVKNVGMNSGRLRVLDDTKYLRFYEGTRFVTKDEHREMAQKANAAVMEAIMFGQGFTHMRVEPLKTPKLKPTSVCVDGSVIMKALTKMLKDEFGIDAMVKSVRPRPGSDLELILK